MSDKAGKTRKPQSERLDEAAQNLEKILKRIAPYVNTMEVENYSTAGKWQSVDGGNAEPTLTQDGFDSILRQVSRPIDELPRSSKKNRT